MKADRARGAARRVGARRGRSRSRTPTRAEWHRRRSVKRAKPATIDEYLAGLGQEQRKALTRLRMAIRSAAPGAEECFSYGVPAFRLDGQAIAGFAAAARHCTFFPMSGRIVARHAAALRGFDTSKGAIRFQPERPLPLALVRRLVRARIAGSRAGDAG